MDPESLKVTLQQVLEDGNLKLIRRDDTLRWEWESFLKVPKMTKVN